MAAEVAAILVERGLGGDDTDLEARLAAFRRDRSAKAADMRRLAVTWGRAAAAPLAGSPRPPQQSSPPQPKAATSAAALLALAFPDRIAKARGERGQFLLANGRGAMLDAHDPLAGSDYLAVGELQGSAAAGRIVLAARLEERELAAVSGNRIVEVLETSFDPAAAALRTRRVRRLGALVLASDPRPPESGEVAAGLLAAGIAGLGLARLPWPQSLLQVRARVAFLRRLEGEPWPDLSDAALAATARNWLAPVLIGKTSLAEIASGDLTEAMEGLLDRELRRRLDQAVPTHFAAPSGRRHPIDYTAPTAPALHIRVQELFVLDRHPTVGAGKLPLTLHLLSPAQRPIQVTRDLPGFWRGSWSAVRSEMRGRYPKHPWPDDPARAVPAGAAKPRAR
jgi:ATP-dependent helicase HrpB